MTEETQNQPDAGVTPQPEGSSAGADLDELLGQYSDNSSPAPKPNVDLSALKPVIDFAKEELATRANERLQTDIKGAADFVKESDGAKEMPDRLVIGVDRRA